MSMETRIQKTRFLLKEGDLTEERVDAIVNAANPSLMGGGGVDGAIHRAGGPAILEACMEIRAKRGSLPTGQAVITTGGELSAKHVIHTVGPVWSGGDRGEDDLLKSCYTRCLSLALKNDLHSVAFPSISTGAYAFPIERAARVAVESIRSWIEKTDSSESLKAVTFVLFSSSDYEVYTRVVKEILGD